MPTTPDDPANADNRRAWEGLAGFDRPFLTVFGEEDPVFSRFDRILQQRVPGAKGQPHQRLAGAGHFIQEDRGEDLARITIEFMAANPLEALQLLAIGKRPAPAKVHRRAVLPAPGPWASRRS